MVTKKYPWLTAFGVSLVSHALAIVLIGALASLYPSIPKDKGPLQVDLVSLAGGGGGGGEEAETSDEPEESQDDEEDYNPPVPADYEADNEAVNDVHEIANKTQEERTKEVKKARSHRRSYTGNGSGSSTGSGSGSGSGVGSGTGSGTGSGEGSGEGAGTGNGTGDGTGEIIGPQLLYSTTPDYPESACVANAKGTVMVGLTISVSGTVTSAWVESSSGNSILDQAAVNSVYSWRFAPAKQNGVAIEVQARVPVSFKLRENI
jgi:hypothetical protein